MKLTEHMERVELTYSGYCERCGVVHSIGSGASLKFGTELFDKLVETGSLLLQKTDEYSTEPLLGNSRGQMFGVMTCLDCFGNETVIKAFSGQYNGEWIVPGWVPPVIDVEAFNRITPPSDEKIKELGAAIMEEADADVKAEISAQRREMSRSLMEKTHDLYTLRNFRGEEKLLREVYRRGRGIPTGTADCCAPKLINYAARNDLVPTGMCEFYLGRENASGTKKHGVFYSSCVEKCEPILGFMLCGLNENE